MLIRGLDFTFGAGRSKVAFAGPIRGRFRLPSASFVVHMSSLRLMVAVRATGRIVSASGVEAKR